jgi:hypothetical protein
MVDVATDLQLLYRALVTEKKWYQPPSTTTAQTEWNHSHFIFQVSPDVFDRRSASFYRHGNTCLCLDFSKS